MHLGGPQCREDLEGVPGVTARGLQGTQHRWSCFALAGVVPRRGLAGRCRSTQTRPAGSRRWASLCQQLPTASQPSRAIIARPSPECSQPWPVTHFLPEAHLSAHIHVKLAGNLEPRLLHVKWEKPSCRLPSARGPGTRRLCS